MRKSYADQVMWTRSTTAWSFENWLVVGVLTHEVAARCTLWPIKTLE